MLLKINFKAEKPIYLQLRNQIVEGIASGELEEEESLPSVRQLAEDLGVNMHTVNKAYKLLEQEGFVSVHKRKNVIVNKKKQMIDHDFTGILEDKLHPIIAESICRGISRQKLVQIIKKVHTHIIKEEK